MDSGFRPLAHEFMSTGSRYQFVGQFLITDKETEINHDQGAEETSRTGRP